MIRGVDFETTTLNPFLCKLPQIIDVEPYDWIIDDVTFEYDRIEGRFSGKEFAEILKNEDEYIFVRMRRYPIGASDDKIDTYDDYITSTCSLVIICTDGWYYEIFDKDPKESEDIYHSCVRSNYKGVEFITDENRDRQFFHGY